ncbi:MAG: hypothetical protein K6A80_08665 [Saccharofermentans sp.]|nr:hypothetical protein [Saccharofermentans sp.]
MSDVKPTTFEEELARNGRLIYSNHGCSMLPLIKQGRDLVVIVRPPESGRLKKYDVPLYRRGDSPKCVLHRIIRVTDTGYVIRGDNTYFKENDITDKEIIGVLSCVVRKGHEVSVESFGYKLYSRVWNFIYPLRFCYVKVRSFGGRVLRKMGLRK